MHADNLMSCLAMLQMSSVAASCVVPGPAWAALNHHNREGKEPADDTL